MRPGIKFGLSLLVFGGVATGSTMYSAANFNEARSARIVAETSDEISVDSIYDDRLESKYDPNYDTSRYKDLAGSLKSDPVFVGPYQTLNVDTEDIDAIRDEVDDLGVPIYVAVLSTSELDDADGEADLIAARIAAELSADEATVLVIGNTFEGIGDKGVVRKLDGPPDTSVDDTPTDVALKFVEDLKAAEVEDAQTAYSHTTDEDGQPIVVEVDDSDDPRALAYPGGASVAGIGLGLIVGCGLGVGTVMTWRTIAKRKRET